MDKGLHGERVCVARGLLAWFSCGKPPLAALQDNTKQKQKLAGEQPGARAGLCPAHQLAQRHEALRFPATGAVSCSLGDQRCGCPRALLAARGPCTGSGLWLRAASKLQGPEASECLPPAHPALKLSPSKTHHPLQSKTQPCAWDVFDITVRDKGGNAEQWISPPFPNAEPKAGISGSALPRAGGNPVAGHPPWPLAVPRGQALLQAPTAHTASCGGSRAAAPAHTYSPGERSPSGKC